MERSMRSCGKPLCDTSIVFDPCTIRPGIGRGTDPGDADGLSLSRIAVHRRLALSLAQLLFYAHSVSISGGIRNSDGEPAGVSGALIVAALCKTAG